MTVPHTAPAITDDHDHAKVNVVAPTALNADVKPSATTRPRKTPKKPPRRLAKEAVNSPSMRAALRASARVNPTARSVANSLRRASASNTTTVTANKTPAAMVKPPKTKNIPERTPEEASACSADSTRTGVNLRPLFEGRRLVEPSLHGVEERVVPEAVRLENEHAAVTLRSPRKGHGCLRVHHAEDEVFQFFHTGEVGACGGGADVQAAALTVTPSPWHSASHPNLVGIGQVQHVESAAHDLIDAHLKAVCP